MITEHINEYLQRTGVSQDALAKKLGFKSQASISNLRSRNVFITEYPNGEVKAVEHVDIPARRHVS